ncbi:MAG: rhodanese-like domain-containing protein [Opitutae bacterium]|nr:rhodanese-like domain-containing protein [Opitutae bacterium]
MNLVTLIIAVVAVAFMVRMLILARPGLDLEAAKASLKSGSAVLVDIREPGEWTGGVAKQAALLPMSDLRGSRTQWQAFLKKHAGKKLLLYCQSGSRSGLAAAQLRKEGVDAVNAGSLRDWDRAGWPVCTPKGLR